MPLRCSDLGYLETAHAAGLPHATGGQRRPGLAGPGLCGQQCAGHGRLPARQLGHPLLRQAPAMALLQAQGASCSQRWGAHCCDKPLQHHRLMHAEAAPGTSPLHATESSGWQGPPSTGRSISVTVSHLDPSASDTAPDMNHISKQDCTALLRVEKVHISEAPSLRNKLMCCAGSH